MRSTQAFDVNNFSSRKLWELVSSGDLTQPQKQLAEHELTLRRRYLDRLGSLHPASNTVAPPPAPQTDTGYTTGGADL